MPCKTGYHTYNINSQNYEYLLLGGLFLKKLGKEVFYYNLKSYNVQYVQRWDFTYRKNSNGTDLIFIILFGSGRFILVEKVSFWFSSVF